MTSKRHALQLTVHSWTSSPRPATLTFWPYRAAVQIEIDPEAEATRAHGPVAGSEGLGSELFFQADATLYALLVEFLPHKVVAVPPAWEVTAAFDRVRAGARPGVLAIKHAYRGALNPQAVWLAEPFGRAIVAFGGGVLSPEQDLVRGLDATDLVEIAHGVIVGLDRTTGALRLIQLDDFASAYAMSGLRIDAARSGPGLLALLGEIQLAYARKQPVADFNRVVAHQLAKVQLVGLEGEAIDKLIRDYRDDLADRTPGEEA